VKKNAQIFLVAVGSGHLVVTSEHALFYK